MIEIVSICGQNYLVLLIILFSSGDNILFFKISFVMQPQLTLSWKRYQMMLTFEEESHEIDFEHDCIKAHMLRNN